MSKAAVRLFLPVAFILAASACSGSDEAQSGNTENAGVNGAAPSTESGGVEQPLPARNGSPGIKVPSLPIGGDDASGRCARVSWSGDEVPQGLGARITGVRFEPNVYTLTGEVCTGSPPPCIGFVFRSSETSCSVGFRPREAAKKQLRQAERVGLKVKGAVLCTDPGGDLCKTFIDKVGSQPGSFTVPTPIFPEGPTTPSTEPSGETSNGSDVSPAPQETSNSPGG